MFIAIDRMSTRLPKDILALEAISATSLTSEDEGETHGDSPLEAVEPAVMNATTLDRWDVQSHQYKTQAKAETSILARLISGSASASYCGVVQEAKRYCVQTTAKDRRVEYGTAVRLSVVILGADLDVAFTLPNIAAKAQLNHLNARIALSVDGYTGPLGELLPAPDNLNVENLVVYTNAFKAIQALVFGEQGLAYIKPTLLGYDDDASRPRTTATETISKQR